MQLINACIIIYILNRFLFKPYLIFIKEEDKKRVELEQAYADFKGLKEKAEVEAETIVETAKKEALSKKQQIEEIANKEKEQIISQASISAKEILESAEAEAERIKLSVVQSAKSNILSLSLKLISKIFGKEMTNKDFLERELEVLLTK